MEAFDLFDIVTATVDRPELGLHQGMVGAIVELLAPDAYEVEFTDANGVPVVSLGLKADEIALHTKWEPAPVAKETRRFRLHGIAQHK
jgi:hypothetical protein